jgi:hypothetical protein
LTKDAVYVDDNGIIMSREKFLVELNPLPQGSSGHIAMLNIRRLFMAALFQKSADVFFVLGKPRDRKIFRRDEHHKIADFIDRREGEDLVYRRTAP